MGLFADPVRPCHKQGMRTDADGIPLIGQTVEEKIDENEEGKRNLDQLVSLVKRLIGAAKEPVAHGSCENGAQCKGCQAVRDGKEFVLAMRA